MSTYIPKLKKEYREKVVPKLKEQFSFKTVMQVPKLEKIVLNQGLGAAVADKKIVDVAVEEMTKISGQKANPTLAKKSISNFKLREGMPIGVRVTLRDERMYEFLEKFIAVTLPRVRDFRGVKNKLDGRGNYTLGITEQIVFPEIDIDKVSNINGMDITFVTNTNSDKEALALLTELGLPFKK